jgi:hypothetical protein
MLPSIAGPEQVHYSLIGRCLPEELASGALALQNANARYSVRNAVIGFT